MKPPILTHLSQVCLISQPTLVLIIDQYFQGQCKRVLEFLTNHEQEVAISHFQINEQCMGLIIISEVFWHLPRRFSDTITHSWSEQDLRTETSVCYRSMSLIMSCHWWLIDWHTITSSLPSSSKCQVVFMKCHAPSTNHSLIHSWIALNSIASS